MDFYEFEKNFGTEEQCRDYLAKLRWKNGYHCPCCQSNEAWKTSEHKYKCKKCGHKVSVTAGTIFQDSHIPLPDWFKAMWYISSQPQKVTAAALQKELGFKSNRTALMMLNKLERAKIRPKLETLQGMIEITERYLRVNGRNIYVVSAVEVNNRKIGRIRIEPISQGVSIEIVDFILNCVEEGSILIYKDSWLRDLFIENGYLYQNKPSTYRYICSQKVLDKAQGWLSRFYKEGEISLYLNRFCAGANSLKSEITFEEFVKNAVRLKPAPRTKKLNSIKI